MEGPGTAAWQGQGRGGGGAERAKRGSQRDAGGTQSCQGFGRRGGRHGCCPGTQDLAPGEAGVGRGRAGGTGSSLLPRGSDLRPEALLWPVGSPAAAGGLVEGPGGAPQGQWTLSLGSGFQDGAMAVASCFPEMHPRVQASGQRGSGRCSLLPPVGRHLNSSGKVEPPGVSRGRTVASGPGSPYPCSFWVVLLDEDRTRGPVVACGGLAVPVTAGALLWKPAGSWLAGCCAGA